MTLVLAKDSFECASHLMKIALIKGMLLDGSSLIDFNEERYLYAGNKNSIRSLRYLNCIITPKFWEREDAQEIFNAMIQGLRA